MPIRQASAQKGSPDFQSVRALRLERELLSEVNSRHPGFLTYFAKSIQSGDPFRVQQALRSGSRRLLEAFARRANTTPKELAKQVKRDGYLKYLAVTGTFYSQVNVWYAASYAVVYVVAVSETAVYVTSYYANALDQSASGGRQSPVAMETMIDLIASRLATAP
jgi:SdpC family antimicrobial peptide